MSREARIGLLALISIGSLVWGYKFLKGKNLFKSSYTFYVEYKQIDGLNVSTPVFINGMEVGTVQDIYLKPEPADHHCRAGRHFQGKNPEEYHRGDYLHGIHGRQGAESGVWIYLHG